MTQEQAADSSASGGPRPGDRVIVVADGKEGFASTGMTDSDAWVAFDDGNWDILPWDQLKRAPPGEKINCRRCGHFFDGSDKRAAFVKPPPSYDANPPPGPECPACAILIYRGTDMWAIWNDCQGFWTDGITETRAEALELLKPGGRYDGLECRVVPCRLLEEHPDNVDLRQWRESQREAERKAP